MGMTVRTATPILSRLETLPPLRLTLNRGMRLLRGARRHPLEPVAEPLTEPTKTIDQEPRLTGTTQVVV